jgi:CheY-like chemotaxis protein
MKLVFVLDDDQDDIYIMQKFLAEVEYKVAVEYITDANELFQLLEKGVIPAMILLDYNFGPEKGMEILKQLKNHPEYCAVPVTVISNSSQQNMIAQSYKNGACSFIQKPATVEEARNKVLKFFHYWRDVSLTVD